MVVGQLGNFFSIMNIIFRADASIHIGSGHIMRCLVLAKELRANGHNVEFISRPQNGDSIEYVKSEGFYVYELPQPKVWLIPEHSSDYLAWLQVPVELDAKHFISKVKSADIVIVDHYALDHVWQEKIKNELNCKIVVIDDLVRKHEADLIIDQTLMRTFAEYQSTNETKDILVGCDYALLNSNFISRREQSLDNNTLPEKPRILISMGGIDKENITLKVLETINLQINDKPHITVLLSNKSPNYNKVKNYCLHNKDWIEHIDFVSNMAEIMLEHSLAIGAPGTTSWERACLGVPNILIPLADNQTTIAKKLRIINASIIVEKENIDTQLTTAYDTIIKNWQNFRINNLKLCDGLGTRRVTQHINNLFSNQKNSITIVKATKNDIEQVFLWQCLPETRKYALTTQIPTWEEHQKWMGKKLESVKDFFYIIKLPNNISVGVIRLDRLTAGEYVISIFISPDNFGQGIAKKALSFIDEIHKDIKIHATVLESNLASQRLFSVANYQRITQESFIRLPTL
jgi:UDP-2,4-diacetamido-2,4,6-trideoxy-beta-L-altropyranose hydrolase